MTKNAVLTETIAGTATIKLAQLQESTYFCTPIEERFERITRLARRALKVPVAAITFLNEEKQWFKSVAGWAVTELPNDQSLCPITLAAGEMTIFEDTLKEAAVSQHPLVTMGPQFRFYAGFPITDENEELCGTFCVFDQKPRRFSTTDQATLMDLAGLTQREILGERMRSAHVSLTAKLGAARRESMMDPLTRLWNRRGAAVMLKAALNDTHEHGSNLGIAILDLDTFKRINDTHGHQVGDEVLRKTALRLIQGLRTDDAACRIGGDEFLLIMKDSDSEMVKTMSERICRQLAETPISTRHGDIRISTSVGYAVRAGNEDESVDQLIERADQALLKSKAQGRNQVVAID